MGYNGGVFLVGMEVWGLILVLWFLMVEILVIVGDVDIRIELVNRRLLVLLLYCFFGWIVKFCLYGWKEENSLLDCILISLVWKYMVVKGL